MDTELMLLQYLSSTNMRYSFALHYARYIPLYPKV
jgi:hypothetical protein